MLAGLFARFVAPYVLQLALGAGLIAALGGLYAFEHHRIYKSGYDAAIADVDAETKRGVDDALGNVKKSRDCRDAGGAWSQSDGVCR